MNSTSTTVSEILQGDKSHFTYIILVCFITYFSVIGFICVCACCCKPCIKVCFSEVSRKLSPKKKLITIVNNENPNKIVNLEAVIVSL